MRPRSTLALLTAAAVAGAMLLGAAPASANSASFTNTSTSQDSGTFHVTSLDVTYTPATLGITFHTQNFLGPGYEAQLIVSDGPIGETSGKLLFAVGDTTTGPSATDVMLGSSSSGFDNLPSSPTPAPDVTITSNVAAQTITVSLPSSHIFWTGGIYVGGYFHDATSDNYAYALQAPGSSASIVGFGPVLSTPAPTTTTVSLTSSTQVYGSTPAAVVATVSPSTAGTLSLMEGATVLTSAPAVNGSALLVVPATLKSGAHSLTVHFTPTDAVSFAPSTSVAVGVTVISSAKATKTTATLSKKSQVYKKKATAKLKISVSHAPAGKVAIYDGKKKIKTVTLKKGKASYTLSKTLKKGTHKIKVIYTPTNKELFKASTSKTVKLVVKK